MSMDMGMGMDTVIDSIAEGVCCISGILCIARELHFCYKMGIAG